MFELLVFRPAFGEPTGSPFCVKAMCLLALAEAEWRPVVVDDPRRMPHGKLPVLRDGDRLIPDSEAIRAHLESFGPDLDAGLSRRERAISRAVIRLADEDLYFHILQDRWADDRVWPQVRAAYFGMIPGLVRRPVTAMIRRQVLRDLHGQGTGRLSAEERAARAERDLTAIAALLDTKPFLFGDRPTAADASVGAMLRGARACPAETPLSARVAGDARLSAYADRVAAALYP